MPNLPDREPSVVVHKSGSPMEALVIRGLLESAGLRLPASTGGDPFPVNQPHSGSAGVDIEVLESQAQEARRIITDYLTSGEGLTIEPLENDPSGTANE